MHSVAGRHLAGRRTLGKDPLFRRLPLLPAALIFLFSFGSPPVDASERRVWFVDNVRSNGDGSRSSPFANLSAAESASGEGDVLFVFEGSGPYRGGIHLKKDQALVGQGVPLDEALRAAGMILADLPKPGGKPILESEDSASIVLASANRVEGLALRATRSPAIAGTGDGGNTLFHDVAVVIAGGDAIVLDQRSGSLRWSGGSIAGSGGAALRVAGGSGEVTIGASIEVRDSIAVRVSHSAVALTLDSVSARSVTRPVENAITLQNAAGGFTLSGGTIEKMSGRSISVIDSERVTIKNVRLIENAANGVSADACGGDLIVGDNAGCNAAIYLQNVRGVTIDGVRIDGTAQIGINGMNVSDVTVTNAEITNAGNEAHEHAMQFRDLLGTSKFANCKVRQSAERALSIENGGGEGSIEIADSSLGESSPKTGNQGVLVGVHGDGRLSVHMRHCTLSGNGGAGFQATSTDRGAMTVDVEDDIFADNGAAIALVGQQQSVLRYTIARNTISGNRTAPISVSMAKPSSGLVSGTISDNTIGRAGITGSGAHCGTCNGIVIWAIGDGRLGAAITGNTIRQVDGPAVRVGAGDGSATIDVTITGNRISEPASDAAPSAIRIQSGTSSTDTAAVCAAVGGPGALANQIRGGWASGIEVVNRFPRTTLRVAGYHGDGKSLSAVAAHLSAANGNAQAKPALTKAPEGNAFSGGDGCPMPQ